MQRQRRQETEPEMRLRRALHRSGLRFRVGLRVPQRPRRTIDIAFTKAKVAVFVDGCFWHVCPQHATWPVNNAAWWVKKLLANVARDRDTDAVLRHHGWEVLRVWEHEDVDESAEFVAALVRRRAS